MQDGVGVRVPCVRCGKVRYVKPVKEEGNLCQSCYLRSMRNRVRTKPDFSLCHRLRDAGRCSHE